MAADYNANLIAELYATNDEDEATGICDEMVEIGDPIFPRQIYQAYKRFKDTTVSHYFVHDLTAFGTTDAVEIVKEIVKTTKKSGDIAMVVDYLQKIKFFDLDVVVKVRALFEDEVNDGEMYDYEMERYLSYLEEAGGDMDELELLLKVCFENDKQSMGVRKVSLRRLLKLKPKDYINFYYENYESIKGKKSEIIFVGEISSWSGGVIPKLHQKILDTGSETAKEILRKEQLKKSEVQRTKEIKEQKEVKEQFETADLISDIASLRSKIDRIALADQRFGFKFFKSSEEIYQQGKSAKDEPTFIGYCMVLRATIGSFSEAVTSIEYSKEKIESIIPGSQEPGRPINKFHLMLADKRIAVNSGLLGLRSLNRIVSKVAHPEQDQPALLELLKQEGLIESYQQGNWSYLHREILQMYKNFLENLLTALEHDKVQ